MGLELGQKAIGMKKQNVFKTLLSCSCDSLRNYLTRAFRVVSAVIFTNSASANTNNAGTCDRVARIVANETGVPTNVLLAITRTETGRNKNGVLSPWPWTVNMDGKGVWFNSQQEALNYALSHFKAGARSFDIGCFQLNYRWHGQHFNDIAHMFDPTSNARYAAEFLSSLYAETTNWDDAAAAYHSRTPKYADKYKTRFKRIMANLPDAGSMPLSSPTPAKPLLRTAKVEHVNNFPLLQHGQSAGALGSLVPRTSGTTRPFLGNGG
ncbi:transglycosylase SLT domain-containing protein [Shimia sp. NS0008-38b]|uniref:transglycosylase SLT domain-containing protein n=1 Tax=Shimia sp. NS0008-38b TaxID=3127653 RepID=UPI003342562B